MITDLWGTDHVIEAGINADHGRVVYYDADPFTPEQAREISRQLLACADLLTNTLIGLHGGAQ